MTLGEGKQKVLKILDEYSSGGVVTTDADINAKMNDFFDMAQKDMSCFVPVVGRETLTLTGEHYTDLPTGFKKFINVWYGDERVKAFKIVDGQLLTDGIKGTYKIEYIKTPTTISGDTPDSYEFEMNEDACNCLPFYVASQQLITDLIVNYGDIWNMYLYHRGNVDTSLPSSGYGRVRQALF